MSAKTINDLELGTYVHGSEGYAVVRGCVHGNKYYAWRDEDENAWREEEHRCAASGNEMADAVEVIDMDEDDLDCCG